MIVSPKLSHKVGYPCTLKTTLSIYSYIVACDGGISAHTDLVMSFPAVGVHIQCWPSYR